MLDGFLCCFERAILEGDDLVLLLARGGGEIRKVGDGELGVGGGGGEAGEGDADGGYGGVWVDGLFSRACCFEMRGEKRWIVGVLDRGRGG